MSLEINSTLHNRYRIDAKIGEGGFGAVYKAHDTSLNRLCAVKENTLVTPKSQKQFHKEAQILGNLNHPNLPRVTDHFIIEGHGQYLVMDFIEGQNLMQIFKQHGILADDYIIPWIRQVCSALEYLHAQNPPIIHRDIKPHNIIVNPQGHVYLVDFGISKVYDDLKSTSMGAKGLTPGFAPIEQYGQGKTDNRSDIYALGATLYFLLTGQAPPESILRVAHDTPLPNPHNINPNVSPRVSQAIMQAMQTSASKRFQHMQDFQAALTVPTVPLPPSQPILPQHMPPVQSQPMTTKSTIPLSPSATRTPTQVPQVQYSDMVEVPAGEFTMGSESGDDDEKPVHTVYLETYYIDKYEITNEQYAEFLNDKGNQTEGNVTWLDIEDDDALIEYSSNQFKTKSGFAKHPVVEVTWYGARAYCEWAGKRLPTEAEWEKAARGTDGRIYPWGDEEPTKELCNFGMNVGDTTPVGKYPKGVSPYGVHDMAGNVWEWTSSHYESYPYNKTDGREDVTLTNVEHLVLRGGSWYDDGSDVRTPIRDWWIPDDSDFSNGFRCSRSY